MNSIENNTKSTYFYVGATLSIIFVATSLAIAVLGRHGVDQVTSFWNSSQSSYLSLIELASASFFATTALHFLHAGTESKRGKMLLRALQIIGLATIIGVTSFQYHLFPSAALNPIVGVAAFAIPPFLYSFLTKEKENWEGVLTEEPTFEDKSVYPQTFDAFKEYLEKFKEANSNKYIDYDTETLFKHLKDHLHLINDEELGNAIENQDKEKSAALFIHNIDSMPKTLVDAAFENPDVLGYNLFAYQYET